MQVVAVESRDNRLPLTIPFASSSLPTHDSPPSCPPPLPNGRHCPQPSPEAASLQTRLPARANSHHIPSLPLSIYANLVPSLPSPAMKQLISKPSSSIPLITLSLLLSPYAANAATPQIDLARMGTVGVAGSFAGFNLFDPSKNINFDPSSSTVLLRATDGSLSPIAATNQGGSIQAACSLDGKLYVGGLFSNIAGVPVQNIASYDPGARSFNALGAQNAGVDGAVSSLYCDASSHTLWVGGKFRSPVPLDASAVQQYGGAVARYTPANNSWSPPPFVGLTGSSSQVYSITPNIASSSLLFGGSFLTQFGSNISLAQNISNPNVPQSSGATPFSTSLVPVPLAGAEIVGSPSSRTSGYSNATNILCPAGADGPGNSWRTLDGSRSVITVRTFRFITASGVRLGNTFVDGRGAKTFSYVPW